MFTDLKRQDNLLPVKPLKLCFDTIKQKNNKSISLKESE